jgi:hypothetical protein
MRTGFIVCAAVAVMAATGGVSVGGRERQETRDQAPGGSASPQGAAVKAGDLLYADFENSSDGKPVSARGGAVNVWTYQEQPTRPSVYKGPSLVRTSKADNNHAAAFEYEFAIPNEWQGVTMEVQGQAGPAGNLPPDDVSGFKDLRVQAYATGTSYMRVEVMSNGERINQHSGYPMTTFKLKDGFNVYKVPLKSLSQPSWVSDSRVDPKEVLKRLTSVTLSVYCEQTCRPDKGMVIVDNLVFEK